MQASAVRMRIPSGQRTPACRTRRGSVAVFRRRSGTARTKSLRTPPLFRLYLVARLRHEDVPRWPDEPARTQAAKQILRLLDTPSRNDYVELLASELGEKEGYSVTHLQCAPQQSATEVRSSDGPRAAQPPRR